MIRIKIIAVGKLKEKYWRDAVDEYTKRLSRYCKLEIIEVKDEKIPERFSEAEKKAAVEAEGDRILKAMDEGAMVITMEIKGKSLSSEAFSQELSQIATRGISDIHFVIGGSLGLSPRVSARSDLKCSFSPMTFPHQLFRIMLLEQLYRAFKIEKGETYHK